jgi:flagellar hook-associated protein 1
MSTFSGLNIGLSSLLAQRRGLELTGHNVANSNTEGYSRQRVRLAADGGPITPAMHARYSGPGNGVTVADTQRLRDAFLEARAVLERGNDGSLRSQQTALARVEGVFGEPSDSGVQSQLADFWSSWDDVANNPTDGAARSQLLQRAATLATGLNGAVGRLEAQWSGSHEQLVGTVDEVNQTASAIADFNKAIMSATRAGLDPNDLTDARDLLVQKLATSSGVSVRPGADGSVDVELAGRPLVAGRTATRLAVGGDTSLTTPAGTAGVVWEDDGAPAAVGGSLKGMLVELNGVLPTYRDGLQAISGALAAQVNAQHAKGFDSSGSGGQDLFTVEAGGRLSVSFTDPAKVAASSTTGGDRGGANAAALAELSTAPGGPDQLYRRLVVTLGVDAQAANRRVDIQADILGQVDAAREAESGVNLDEEMTSMLAYQRAYEGAARFMSSVDQLLDTLINRTGRVGL